MAQTTTRADFESYVAQHFYGIGMVPHPLQDRAESKQNET